MSFNVNIDNRDQPEKRPNDFKMPLIEWGPGFYSEERDKNNTWHWSKSNSELILNNTSSTNGFAVIYLEIGTPYPKVDKLTIKGNDFVDTLNVSSDINKYKRKIKLNQGINIIKFDSTIPAIKTNDPRELSLIYKNFKILQCGIE
jgi:hypothetical protein